MKDLSLFEKTSTYDGIYLTFMVNRFQTLYYALIMPNFLVQPYMIWGIIIIGLLSHFNVALLFKWLGSERAAKGFDGIVEMFGKKWTRFLALIGVIPIGVYIITVSIGFAEMIRKFIFPSIDLRVPLGLVVALCAYVASHGMEKTIRLVVIVFLSSAWIVLVFLPVLALPSASHYDLFPLIPTERDVSIWKRLLFLWSSFSGPEYLLCLAPWLNLQRKQRKFAFIGNAISVLEFLFLFVVSLLFFGAAYLKEVRFPIVYVCRYLQFPLFERIDVLLISIQMFNFVFVIAIFLLLLYGAIRIVAGWQQKPTTRFGMLICFLAVFSLVLMIENWIRTDAFKQNDLITIQIWLGAITYLTVPCLLQFVNMRRGSRKDARV